MPCVAADPAPVGLLSASELRRPTDEAAGASLRRRQISASDAITTRLLPSANDWSSRAPKQLRKVTGSVHIGIVSQSILFWPRWSALASEVRFLIPASWAPGFPDGVSRETSE